MLNNIEEELEREEWEERIFDDDNLDRMTVEDICYDLSSGNPGSTFPMINAFTGEPVTVDDDEGNEAIVDAVLEHDRKFYLVIEKDAGRAHIKFAQFIPVSTNGMCIDEFFMPPVSDDEEKYLNQIVKEQSRKRV